MSDIIKNFKKFLVKNENLTRNSHGKEFKSFLYCYTKNKRIYSQLIHPYRGFYQENIILKSSTPDIFNDSLFEGEYFNGIFYITNVVKCDSTEFEIEGVEMGIRDSEYTYIFDCSTFEEKWIKKINISVKKVVVKDTDFIEIYRIKDTNEVVRIKSATTAKKLKNMFLKKSEVCIDTVFNDRFNKWEITE